MFARAAVSTAARRFPQRGLACRALRRWRLAQPGRRVHTGVCVASTSFSDDIRGYDRTASSTSNNNTTNPTRPNSGVTVSIPHLTALLLDLNNEGQHIIRAVVAKGDLVVLDKNKKNDKHGTTELDAQTEADRRVEAHVLRALRSFCPDLVVVAEESYENPTAVIQETDTFDDLTHLNKSVLAPFPSGKNAVVPKSYFSQRAMTMDSERSSHDSSISSSKPPLDWPPHLLDEIDTSRVVVFVDPLDGTNEFAGGARECVTSLMGVAVDGTPVVGIIGQPFFENPDDANTRLGRIVWGGRGLGIFGLDVTPRHLTDDSVELSPKQLTCCINRATKDDRLDQVIADLNLDVLHKVSATGFHFLLLLEGKADCALLLRPGTKKWDSCPGEALLRACGGSVTDAAGRLYDYGNAKYALNKSGLVSTRDARRHFQLVSAARGVAMRNERHNEVLSEVPNTFSYYPLNVSDKSIRNSITPSVIMADAGSMVTKYHTVTESTRTQKATAPPGGWRALTVDVGGCLLTPKEKVVDTYMRVAKSIHGLDTARVTETKILSAIRSGFKKPVPHGNPEGIRYVGDGRSFWRGVVFDAMGGELTDYELEKALNLLYEHYEKPTSWHVAPGAKEAFQLLRKEGIAVAVVSNWDTRLPTLLRACGFDESHFSHVVVSAEVLSDKPEARIFEIAMERINQSIIREGGGNTITASQVLHVGDSTVNDVDGALKAGFGGALLWNSTPKTGAAFDFAEIAEAILQSRRV